MLIASLSGSGRLLTHDRGLRHWRNISVAAGSFTSRLSNRCILSATPAFSVGRGCSFFCALIQAPIIGSGEKGAALRQQPELTVEEVPTDELVPYARNAKVHTNEQINQIVKSIEEFGFNDPIAVWHNEEGAMEIIEGHGRVLAAKKLGLDVLPVVTLDHLTNDQRRAYTHVHNQLTMNTGWDLEMLSFDLDELDFDFEGFGFDSGFDAIQDLLDDDLVSFKDEFEKSSFNVTFTFPADKKQSVKAFLDDAGKDQAVSIIVKAAEQWE